MPRSTVPPERRVIVALDTPDLEKANKLVEILRPNVGGFKIGLEFISAVTSKVIKEGDFDYIHDLQTFFSTIGSKLMWDGKFHDIPNTMGSAAGALAEITPWAFTVHASSGTNSLEAAVAQRRKSLVLAVTVLTSLDEGDTRAIFGTNVETQVGRLAEIAFEASVDGLVCSPKELAMLRRNPNLDEMLLVVPGIRPSWAATNDQQRITGPEEAIRMGADHLVIGRPITSPPDGMLPEHALERVLDEIRWA